MPADTASEEALTVKHDYCESCAEAIKSYRIKQKLTKRQLAAEMGVTYPSIVKWESGRVRISYRYWQRFLGLGLSE